MNLRDVVMKSYLVHGLEQAFAEYLKKNDFQRRGHLDYGFVFLHPVKSEEEHIKITYRAHLKDLTNDWDKVVIPVSLKVPEHYCEAWKTIPEKDKKARALALNQLATEYGKKLEAAFKAQRFPHEVTFGEESVFSKTIKDEKSEEIKQRTYLLINLEFDFNTLLHEEGDDDYLYSIMKTNDPEERHYGLTIDEIVGNIVKLGGESHSSRILQNWTPSAKVFAYMKSKALANRFNHQINKVVEANKTVLDSYEK